MIEQMKEIKVALADDWVAKCGVCDERFAIRNADCKDNPHPRGSFCPFCQHMKLIAPGVLHWKRRVDETFEARGHQLEGRSSIFHRRKDNGGAEEGPHSDSTR